MSRSPGGLLLLAGVAGRAEAHEGSAAVRAALLPVFVGHRQVLQYHRDRLGLRSLSGDVGGQRVFVEQVGKRGVHGISPVVKITTSPSRCE